MCDVNKCDKSGLQKILVYYKDYLKLLLFKYPDYIQLIGFSSLR